MKTIYEIENKNDLRNILTHEDVVLHIKFLTYPNAPYRLGCELSGNSSFSIRLLGDKDFIELIEELFEENGMVVKFK